MDSKVRLHIAGPLASGQPAALTRDQAHYLGGVMRLAPGDTITVFDGASGAWRARIAAATKRGGHVEVEAQVAPQRDPPDLWLLFAPIKKARTDFIVEKATELGARRILPVSTRHTNSERIRRDRLQAHAVEAAEQCGGTYVPEVAEIAALGAMLDHWPTDRALIFCDEALSGDGEWGDRSNVGHLNGGRETERLETYSEAMATKDVSIVGHLPGRMASGPGQTDPAPSVAEETSNVGQLNPASLPSPPAAILIGPEGGFSPEERIRLRSMPQTTPITLGPRILRADTAAIAALTLWQATCGDWT